MTGLPTVDDVDDRMRLILGVTVGIVIALAPMKEMLWIATAQAGIVLSLARNHRDAWLKRVLALNVFLGMIVIILPWGIPGAPIVSLELLGGASYSKEGLEQAGLIAWRVNAIFAVCWGLVATMTPIQLGTVILDLKLSSKLAQLVFFSFRYVDELKVDLTSIRRAMHARGYVVDVMHLRGAGYLLGNLLTRSLDRSERILSAMQSRGFVGRFPRLSNSPALRIGDWALALILLVPAVAVAFRWRCL